MKLAPAPLPPIPTNNSAMDRLPIAYPELMMRYGMGFPAFSSTQQQSHALPLFDFRLPSGLTLDPRCWSRDDVTTFLHWAEREYALQPIDLNKFQINGKAICILTRNDLAERAPGSGDVLYNVLHMLIRDNGSLQRVLPNSPITPNTRNPYSLTHPAQPPWSFSADPNSIYTNAAAIAHLMVANNSVSLSPVSSNESQPGSSPKRDTNGSNGHSSQTLYNSHSIFGGGHNETQPSDSEDERSSSSSHHNLSTSSPPNTPLYPMPISFSIPPKSPLDPAIPRSPAALPSVPTSASSVSSERQFFPPDLSLPPSEPMQVSPTVANVATTGSGSGGRLLWDFLINLLNDPAQRYTQYITWKNKETGVFKIVDPAGLARLWGRQKNHLSMNYDKMSRALRYYYKVNILRKVPGERHCYQFLKGPGEMKTIKTVPAHLKSDNFGSISSTSPSPFRQAQKPDPVEVTVKFEYDDEQPTDLTMEGPTDLSNNSSRHSVSIVCSPDTPHMKDLPPYIKEEKP